MTTPLECVDSTLAPRAVLQALREVYPIGSAASCELIQRHLDAVYVVSSSQGRLVARVFNARGWSREEVEGEVAVLRHLEARGVRVAAPLRRTDGGTVSSVQAPEGERQLLVYEYLEGTGLIPSRDARAFGELVGSLHRALAGFVLSQRRRELTLPGLLESCFDDVLAQLSPENENRRYLEELRERVATRAEQLGVAGFRQGLCHGDLHFANAVRQPDGQLALFDFESCGVGMLAYDLAVFRWVQRVVGAPESSWQDFLDGYRSVQALPEPELAAMDLLVLLRQAFMLGHDARRTRIESLGTRWRHARRPAPFDALRRLDAELFGTRDVQGW